jgi:hypothetical protein
VTGDGMRYPACFPFGISVTPTHRLRPVTWGTVYLLPREQRAECGSVMVPITDAWCIGCNTGDTTMNDIENTELTDQDLGERDRWQPRRTWSYSIELLARPGRSTDVV